MDKVKNFIKEYVTLCKKYGLAMGYDTFCLAQEVTSLGVHNYDAVLGEMLNVNWENSGDGTNFEMV